MAEALYKAQEAKGGQEGQGQSGPGPSTSADGEVVDAEFAETK